MKKKLLSFLLVLVMLASLVPATALAANTYDPDKAIAWATNKTNFNNFSGKCASYVSRCLREGGLTDVKYTTPGAMVEHLENKSYGTTYSINDTNLKKIKAGDVIMVYCKKGHDSSKYWGLHTIFVTAVDQTNKKITYCAKNNDHFCDTMTFSALKSYASKIKCNSCGSYSNSVGVFVSMKTSTHTHSYKTAVTAPTCTAQGYTTYTCSCGYSYVGNYTAARGHSYTVTATKKPTCTNQGYTTYICSCGDTYTNYTSALGHNYINGVCSRCNAKLSSGFTDVKAGAYCFDAVKWAVTNNVTNGIGGGMFDPDGSCTRAQIVTLLWRANGSPKVSSLSVFSDVKEGEYYYDAVRWAVANGITNGVGGGKFDPEDKCSRSQIVTFLWRANGSPVVSGTTPFPDVKPGAYYYDAVRWAAVNGIATGSDGGRFDADGTCTRAQAVTFLYRTYGN